MAAILLAVAQTSSAPVAAQDGAVPLSPDTWTATDSIRSVSYLGRPALYINRGVALVRGAAMENGTLDLDVAASDTTNFLGVAFRATSPRFSNVVFLRPGASGTEEAVQPGVLAGLIGWSRRDTQYPILLCLASPGCRTRITWHGRTGSRQALPRGRELGAVSARRYQVGLRYRCRCRPQRQRLRTPPQ
jgi:hypothetical protein